MEKITIDNIDNIISMYVVKEYKDVKRKVLYCKKTHSGKLKYLQHIVYSSGFPT